MPVMLKPVDVAVIGTGAAGGTALWPLANAGLKVVAIEAGPRATVRDYPFDEVRNDVRDTMAKWKSNWEVPTSRPNPNVAATRPLGAVGPMMNAVGGTSIHWMTQSWRFLPWNFKMVSESIKRYGANAIPKDCTSIDWPFDYAEIEPYYDKHEYFAGVSGQRVALSLTNVTVSSGSVTVLNPDASVLAPQRAFARADSFIDPLDLSQTGVYTVVLNPKAKAVGSVTVTAASGATAGSSSGCPSAWYTAGKPVAMMSLISWTAATRSARASRAMR